MIPVKKELYEQILKTKVTDIEKLEEGSFSVIVNKVIIQICKGDITREKTDAITNAANSELWLGGGVAGAIRNAGGPSIQQQCKKYVAQYGPVPVGGAGWTEAGDMPSKFVIHAVGPVYNHYEPEVSELLLTSCLINILEHAKELEARSVSIPAISSGIFGFPVNRCAAIL